MTQYPSLTGTYVNRQRGSVASYKGLQGLLECLVVGVTLTAMRLD